MDKVAHFFGSAYFTLIILLLNINFIYALIIISVVGYIKEKTDDFFDKNDIVANTLGYILGVLSFELIKLIK